MRDARQIVDALLETGVDDIEPEQFVSSYADKESWLVPHEWVGLLRPLGFRLTHHKYTADTEDGPVPREFWGAEKTLKTRTGDRVRLSFSGYEQPELLGSVGADVHLIRHSGEETGFWSSRPIQPNELVRVTRDIIRRIERCECGWLDPNTNILNTLKPYEHWEYERRKKRRGK